MTLKSLLLAATMVGGLAFGASAANAQEVLQYSVTGGTNPAYDGSLDYIDSPLSISTADNKFYAASNGTGAYAGVTEISFSTVTDRVGLFYGSNNVYYTITPAAASSTGSALVGDIIGDNSSYTISPVSAAPEPGVWVLMIAGVAVIGSLLRASNKPQGAFSVA